MLYRISVLTPHRFEMMAAVLAVLALYYRIGKTSGRANLASAISIFVLLIWLSVCTPATFVLVVPAVLLTALVMLAGSDDRKKFAASCGIRSVLLCWPRRRLRFFSSNYFYSTPAFFMTEFVPIGLFLRT